MPQGWRPIHPGDPTPKWGLSKAGRLVIAITVAVGVVIAVMIIAIRPAGASESLASPVMSQEPSPEPPPWFGGRVEMPEHGFAVTLPDDWVVFDPAGDIEEQLAAFDRVIYGVVSPQGNSGIASVWASTGARMVLVRGADFEVCYLFTDRLVNGTLEGLAWHMFEWAEGDPALRDVELPQAIDLPVGTTYLLRMEQRLEPFMPEPSADPWTPVSWYVIGSGDRSIFLDCHAGFERPGDDWLSVAEAVEFLPADE